MGKTKKIDVLSESVSVQTLHEEDYICITDIARYQEPGRTDHVIQNWMRNRNMALFGMMAKQWRESHPDDKGNIRDHANAAQLVCLSNLENLTAHFIVDGLSREERLVKLNQTAIRQMELLTSDSGVKKLK